MSGNVRKMRAHLYFWFNLLGKQFYIHFKAEH